MAETPEREPWHLDKRIPVATLIVLAVQFGGVVWMLATLAKTVETVSLEVDRNRMVNAAQDSAIRIIDLSVARQDQRQLGIIETLSEIKASLLRLEGKR
ncbi:hypothetical protein ACFO5X_10200 [Seohaeicola nanhaiensis]|uniref:Uncharacterized protein n=1 Tax=Seohaeicola nanhaiensis TaxID=1387282 RepID=A0ABV9KFI4_9RHOB